MKLKIITTRPAGKSTVKFKGQCIEVKNVPVTKLVVNDLVDMGKIRDYRPTTGIFTSAYGAEIFLSLVGTLPIPGMKAIAIGEKTANALHDSIQDVLVPEEKSSSGVIELLDHVHTSGDRLVLFASAKTNGIILSHMETKNWDHLLVELYDAEALDIGPLLHEAAGDDCFGIIITSSMEAEAIFGIQHGQDLEISELSGKHIFAIGKTTSSTLSKLGIKISPPLGKSNLDELLSAIESEYCR